MLLGRVLKDQLLNRDSWEFYCGLGRDGQPVWDKNDEKAKPIFSYFHMTGEDHITYNPGLRRYILGNFSFLDPQNNPRPYHQAWPESSMRSQLTLYEAPEPWEPWSLFYRDDDWDRLGGYQPVFPTKWMSEDGKMMWMVSSGSYEDYNFTIQKFTLRLAE